MLPCAALFGDFCGHTDEASPPSSKLGYLKVVNAFRVRSLCVGVSLALVAGSAFASQPDPNRVLVQFKPGAKANVERSLQAAGARFHHSFDELNAFAVTVPEAALNGLRNNPNVLLVEQDAPRYPMAQTVPYGIDLVQAPQAWAAGHTGNGITVCVIDSGLKTNHEDISGAKVSGGFPSGYNNDTCGHGTHVAGTIAAIDNASGVVGVSPGDVNLFIVKVFDGASCGWSYSSSLIDAANRCAAAGAKIINMSLGGSTSSTTESNGFANLYNQGILSIAAAGNDGNNRHSYPASYSSVVSVAAVDANKAHASFSQYTNQVELAAPGVAVLSTVPWSAASTTVDGTGYLVSTMDGSVQQSRSGAIANGGDCSTVGSWSGRVVMCERGGIAFNDKARNVQAGGGVAAIIYNNVAGSFAGTLGTTNVATIPTVAMSREDGVFIVGNKIGTQATVNTSSDPNGSGYEAWDGTSMATPHVSGAAAVVWSAVPDATNQQVRDALAATAEDLGAAGRDNYYGHGLIRVADAIAYLQGNGGGGGGGGGGDPGTTTAVVDSVTVSASRKGKNWKASAAVSVRSTGGQAIAGASVTGCFTGAVSGCGTGTTGSNGTVTFSSANYGGGSVSFCVNSVSGTGISFQAGANDCGSN